MRHTLAVLDVVRRDAQAEPPGDAVQWRSSERMRTMRRVRVWLDADGQMLPRRYYEIID